MDHEARSREAEDIEKAMRIVGDDQERWDTDTERLASSDGPNIRRARETRRQAEEFRERYRAAARQRPNVSRVEPTAPVRIEPGGAWVEVIVHGKLQKVDGAVRFVACCEAEDAELWQIGGRLWSALIRESELSEVSP